MLTSCRHCLRNNAFNCIVLLAGVALAIFGSGGKAIAGGVIVLAMVLYDDEKVHRVFHSEKR